ncbi:hypothetical protein B9Z19DRAFT_966204, partial [Tuber borchii]
RDNNNIARRLNSRVVDGYDPLEPFYGADGQPIPDFPDTWADVAHLTSRSMNSLLVALGLNTRGKLPQRRYRLGRHIGVVKILEE